MTAVGIWAAAGYRLSRHRLLGLPLDVASALAAGGAVLYALATAVAGQGWRLHPALAAMLILWCGAVLDLRRRSFIFFRPDGSAIPSGPPLEPLQAIPLRASGRFAVNDECRYFVEAQGQFEATALGERILMVVVQPVSVLGLLGSPAPEWGCWYVFFQPEELQEITSGVLLFGPRARPALRLRRRAQGERQASLWLSFADLQTRNRVAADLQAALPPRTPQVHPS